MSDWMKHKLESRFHGNIYNLRYEDDTLMAESKEEIKRFLRRVKNLLKSQHSKKKIMLSGPIIAWQIDRKTMEMVTDFIFWAPKLLQMVISAMKLKDTSSLEEKL